MNCEKRKELRTILPILFDPITEKMKLPSTELRKVVGETGLRGKTKHLVLEMQRMNYICL